MRQCRYTTRPRGDVDDVVPRLSALWTVLTTGGPTNLADEAVDDRLLDWVAAAVTRCNQRSPRPSSGNRVRRGGRVHRRGRYRPAAGRRVRACGRGSSRGRPSARC